MFNWNVEKMKLLNMDRVGEGYDKAFACESEVSIEDKFEFVDRMQNGELSYLVGLVKDFQEAIPSMKKDSNGNPTEYAKRAWVRKNETQGRICRTTDSYNNYGDFYLLDYCCNIFTYPNTMKSRWKRTEDEYISKLFHKQLEKCEYEEHCYYVSQNRNAKFLSNFKDKLDTLGISRLAYDLKEFSLFVYIAKKPSEKNEVSLHLFEKTEQPKELSLEEVHEIDATLSALDEWNAELTRTIEFYQEKIKRAEQAYEEAKMVVVERIKSFAE